MAGLQVRLVRAALICLLILILLAVASLALVPLPFLSVYFFTQQDLPVAIGLALLFLLWRQWKPRASWRSVSAPARPDRLVWLIALAVALVSLAGGWLLFHFYALSMDEFWARADGVILATGKPMARIPAEWQPYAPALLPVFTRLLPESGLWVSTYLPVNAAIQQLLGVLASPLMAGLSVLLAADLARKLVPGERYAPLLCAMLMASSSQLLITAMTPYAMTGHLFFNLLWLWLFLRPGMAAQAGAMVTGLLAMGLHQAALFPLFALPFLLEAFLQRRRLTAVLHLIVIAAGFLAWSNYDLFAYWVMDAAPSGKASSGSGWLLGKLFERLGNFGMLSVGEMALNLLRFQLWQNPVVVPLLLLVALPLVRIAGPMRALLVGMVITILFMFLVIPFQGHGWGYRYLHGLLGNACLLATYGYYRLTLQDGTSEAARTQRDAMAVMLLAGAVMLLLPLHGWQAWQQARPYVVADTALRQWKADVIVVDAPAHAYTIDLVRNDPLLRNTPRRIAYAALAPGQMQALCARYRVRLFNDTDAEAFGIARWAPSIETPRDYPADCEFSSR